MHDADGMRLGHGVAGLQNAVYGRFDRHRAARFEHGSEIAPIEIFHHDIRRARVEGAHVEDPSYVIAAQANGCPGLAAETLDQSRLGETRVEHELERDPLVKLQMSRRDHDSHATDSENPVNSVLPGQNVARLNRKPARWILGTGHRR
jgi:hypothetical protein